jgi:hypothetical protein
MFSNNCLSKVHLHEIFFCQKSTSENLFNHAEIINFKAPLPILQLRTVSFSLHNECDQFHSAYLPSMYTQLRSAFSVNMHRSICSKICIIPCVLAVSAYSVNVQFYSLYCVNVLISFCVFCKCAAMNLNI